MREKITFFLLSKKAEKIVKKATLGVISFLVFFIITFLFNQGFSEAKQQDFDTNFAHKKGEILVKFINDKNIYTFYFNENENLDQILDAYNSNDNVEFAELNYLYKASIIPSDSYFNNQWYLKKIKAPEAWNISHDSKSIIIAVIDSGVQNDHPDLKENIWKNNGEIINNGIDDDKNGFIDDINGWDFISNSSDVKPKFSKNSTLNGVLHGTIVAGIIAAGGNNAAGISGITWQSQIMPLKVLDDKGEGDSRNVIRAIDYAISNKADIINLSFVGFGYSRALESAISRAYDAGVIIVAAAGNDGVTNGNDLDKTPMYPICYEGTSGENLVIGVAATDSLDQKAVFSGYGSKCVDIAAPGVSIFSTVVYSPLNSLGDNLFDKYFDGYWSGTSMAVPMVSGSLSLIMGLNPGLSRDEVVDALLNNADNINRLNSGYIEKLGSGRLNVYKSVFEAQKKLSLKTVSLVESLPSNNNEGIKISDREGGLIYKFIPYENFRGGVNIAAGDIDGDGKDEIITAPRSPGGAHIKIFSFEGKMKSQFFSYDNSYHGGVNIAAGDIDGDGKDEIITAPVSYSKYPVKIFNYKNKLISQFFAYGTAFKGGVNIAAGDIDDDGKDEIITGPEAPGGPHVKVFSGKGILITQFFAFDKKFRGGVKVAVANVEGGVRNHKLEILTAPGQGGGPQVMIYNNYAQKLGQFFAYDKNFKGGITLSSGDLNYDGLDEIITGAGQGGAPHVRVFERKGKLLYSFYAFAASYNAGVNACSIKY